MRLAAYILAADPSWVIPSVRSYYDIVDTILVSVDVNGLGWTGNPISSSAVLAKVTSLDRDHKVRVLAEDYASCATTPMARDTYQRQRALDSLGSAWDWILCIDTDELLPEPKVFLEVLSTQVPESAVCVNWPMRVFFHRLSSAHFLEVTTPFRRQHSEYPGPVAVRPRAELRLARRCAAPPWRVGIRKRIWDPVSRESRNADCVISPSAAILHMSWVRSRAEIMTKVSGWSHSQEFDGPSYVRHVWDRTPYVWPLMSNFHPISPRAWPALWPTRLPAWVSESADL
jgi:hypothetical protein